MFGKFRQYLQDVIDILFRVTGGNLETDFFIAFGHHREIEAGHQDIMGKEVFDQGGGFSGIPDQQRHDWVGANKDFKAQVP
jgi:hypothetical protein